MQELTRKLIHLVFGLGIAGMLGVLDTTTATAILAGGLFFGIILVDLVLRGYRLPAISALVHYVDRSDPLPGKGALYFAISALTCVILFSKPVVIPALVSLAVLDGVATIAGTSVAGPAFTTANPWRGQSPQLSSPSSSFSWSCRPPVPSLLQ